MSRFIVVYRPLLNMDTCSCAWVLECERICEDEECVFLQVFMNLKWKRLRRQQKFREDFLIGKGGFGKVYKGNFRHIPIAVKVLSKRWGSPQIKPSFYVVLIEKIDRVELRCLGNNRWKLNYLLSLGDLLWWATHIWGIHHWGVHSNSPIHNVPFIHVAKWMLTQCSIWRMFILML